MSYEWTEDEERSISVDEEYSYGKGLVTVLKMRTECKTHKGVEYTLHDYQVALGSNRSGGLAANVSMDAPAFVDGKAEYKKILHDIVISLAHVLPFIEDEYRKRAPHYRIYADEDGACFIGRHDVFGRRKKEKDGVVVQDMLNDCFSVLVRQPGTDILWKIIEVFPEYVGEACYGRDDALGLAMLIRDMLELRYDDIAELFAESE